MEYLDVDGNGVDDTVLYLANGDRFATYFNRHQRYVARDGTPLADTGPYERHMEGYLW